MPISKELIKTRLRLFIDKNRNEEDTEKAVEDFTEELSSIIADAILSATITAAPGSIVVVGSPTTQTNPNPIIFQIN